MYIISANVALSRTSDMVQLNCKGRWKISFLYVPMEKRKDKRIEEQLVLPHILLKYTACLKNQIYMYTHIYTQCLSLSHLKIPLTLFYFLLKN